MKKIIEAIKKKDIDIFALITFIVTVLAFYKVLRPYDDLWLFSYTYKMNLGYKIYNDLNIIVTPLFFLIGNLFFKIFSPNYLTFNIYAIVTYVSIFMLIFKLFKTLEVKRRRAIIYTIIIIVFYGGFISAGTNYNSLVLIPILITIILLIKGYTNNYLLGIMCFIVFLIKQNISAYFIIGIMLYKLTENVNLKQKIKDILKIAIIFAILLAAFIAILYKQNTLYNFINYCFLGINEFGLNNISINLENGIKMALFIELIILNIFILKNKKVVLNQTIRNNIKVLICIGAPMLLMAYPIVNIAHVLKGGLIIIIEFLYLIDSIFLSELITNRKLEKRVYTIIITMVVILILIYIGIICIYLRDGKTFEKNSPYYGIIATESLYNEITNICSYIKQENINGVDVKVLSYKANLYMVPLNKNNIGFDLPNLGNLGKDGEEGLINQIKAFKNTKILIQTNEEDMFWQESKKVRKYILENYNKIGTIEDFDIYYIK